MKFVREAFLYRSLMLSVRLFTLFAVLLFTQLANAESNPRQQADSLFAAGEFEKVEMLVLRLGGEQGAMSDSDYVGLQVTAGFAMIMLDREADARRYFETALDKNAGLALDPVLISPKFRIVFDDVKIHRDMPRNGKPAVLQTGADYRSHLLNLVLPGAGLIREGRLRGIGYLAAQAAAVTYMISQLDKTADSRTYYLAQVEEPDIARAYSDYNSDYHSAQAAELISGAIYLLAQADLALVRNPVTSGNSGFSMSILPAHSGIRFSFHW